MDDEALHGIISYADSEEEYVETIGRLIRNRANRESLGESLRRNVLSSHTGPGWKERLWTLYRKLDRIQHDPRPIPTGQCCATSADVAISIWHACCAGDAYAYDALRKTVAELVHSTAYVARERGDYRGASTILLSGMGGFRSRNLMGILKLFPHRLLRSLRANHHSTTVD